MHPPQSRHRFDFRPARCPATLREGSRERPALWPAPLREGGGAKRRGEYSVRRPSRAQPAPRQRIARQRVARKRLVRFRATLLFHLLAEQLAHRRSEGVGDPSQRPDRRLDVALLQMAELRRADAGLLRERRLLHPDLLPPRANPRADRLRVRVRLLGPFGFPFRFHQDCLRCPR